MRLKVTICLYFLCFGIGPALQAGFKPFFYKALLYSLHGFGRDMQYTGNLLIGEFLVAFCFINIKQDTGVAEL